MKTGLASFILLAAALSTVNAETVVERVDLAFSMEEGDTVRLSSLQGSVKVTQAPGGELLVQAVKRVEAGGDEARRFLEQIDVEADQEPGCVIITTTPPQEALRRGGIWSWKGPSWGVDYHLEVPAMGSVDLSVTAGDIVVEGFTGSVMAASTSGDIQVGDIGVGPVSLQATSGDVGATGLDTDLSVSVTSGDVAAEDVAGSLSVDAVSGDVSGRALGDNVRVTSVSGDVLAVLETVECPHVYVECVSGDVALSLSKEASASVSVTTASGDVNPGGLPIRAIDARQSKWEGTVGDGCGTIEIETVGGDVSIGY